MREKMIDVLQGLLDDAERVAFESFVAEDPSLSNEWKAIRRAASMLVEFGDAVTPPSDLAERTHRRLILFLDSSRGDPLTPERDP